MEKEKRGTLNGVLQVLSILILIAMILIAGGIILAPHFGWQIAIVYSGSMEPAIKIGSLAIVKPVSPENIKKDEIISYFSPSNPKLSVIHRVVKIVKDKEGLSFQTKGDANKTPENYLVPAQKVKGRLWLNIPYAGHVIDFIKKPIGFALALLIPIIIAISLELKSIKTEIKKSSNFLKKKEKLEPSQVQPEPLPTKNEKINIEAQKEEALPMEIKEKDLAEKKVIATWIIPSDWTPGKLVKGNLEIKNVSAPNIAIGFDYIPEIAEKEVLLSKILQIEWKSNIISILEGLSQDKLKTLGSINLDGLRAEPQKPLQIDWNFGSEEDKERSKRLNVRLTLTGT